MRVPGLCQPLESLLRVDKRQSPQSWPLEKATSGIFRSLGEAQMRGVLSALDA